MQCARGSSIWPVIKVWFLHQLQLAAGKVGIEGRHFWTVGCGLGDCGLRTVTVGAKGGQLNGGVLNLDPATRKGHSRRRYRSCGRALQLSQHVSGSGYTHFLDLSNDLAIVRQILAT